MPKNTATIPTTIISTKNFLINSIAFFLPLYLVDIGLSGFQIGLLLSIFAITSLISSSFAGLFSDRYPVRHITAFSFIFLVVYFTGLYWTINFWILVILFFIGGLGNRFSDIAVTSFILKTTNNKNTGKKLGAFDSIKTVSSGIGALIGGLLLVKIKFTNLFLFLALLFFVLTLFTFFIKRIETFKYSLKNYKGDLFRKEILIFMVLIFTFAIHWGAESTSYALFLRENLGLSQAGNALFIGTIWILYGIMIYFVGTKVKDNSNLKKLIYVGLILSGLGHILFTYPNIYSSYIFRLIHELGDAAFELFLLIGIFRHFPTGRLGGDSGVILTVTVAGKFLGSILFGWLGDFLGYEWPFIVSGLLNLACLALAYFYFKSLPTKKQDINIGSISNKSK